jgi:hypothetical protein
VSRLGPVRLAGIVGWTAVATGWVAAVITRTAPPLPAGQEQGVTAGDAVTESVEVAPQAAVPALPDGGLVIIRSAPRPAEPQVETRVVVRQPAPVQPAPPRVVSSGS